MPVSEEAIAQLVHYAEQSSVNKLDQNNGQRSALDHPTPEKTSSSTQDASETNDTEEQALEWHEVIELQAFIERKVWIEEKIKFLGQMPPVEVFVGLDAVRASQETVPGLPTREELQQWVAEHDRIEKETEIFDSGELKKLKKFTKAATQRNLSPADTDLIEITLTTIYELDKLLHLLRDRSENLDLLGVRLSWEERRISAWKELRNTINDIKTFLNDRARWSPAVYEEVDSEVKEDDSPAPTPAPHSSGRRGSVVSMVSVASDTSIPSSLGISRGARFQLAEQLSREAAQLASRVSSLRHSKINAAGKALDKLIDGSRRPVPDELLDEQDKLEDQGISSMEDVGKFIMGVVMQWKKADEMYVETVKDQNTAQTLLDDIEIALMSHPTTRQDAAFLSRSNALSKRLLIRGNPSLSTSFFPRPAHPLFPEQQISNGAVEQLLSSEYITATDYSKKVEEAAKQYHSGAEAVKKVESMYKASSVLTAQYRSIVGRLEAGIETSNDDGTPPDLSSIACLQTGHHAVFAALLPTLLQELQVADNEFEKIISPARIALQGLSFSGINPQFTQESSDGINQLPLEKQRAADARELAINLVSILEEVRQLWSDMDALYRDMEVLRCDLTESVEGGSWRQQARRDNTLLTPDSSIASLPAPSVPSHEFRSRLQHYQTRLHDNILTPLQAISPKLGPTLREYLDQSSSGLSTYMANLFRLHHFRDSVLDQSSVMSSVQDEANRLQDRAEDLRIRFDDCTRDVLAGVLDDNLKATQQELETELAEVQARVQDFVDGLTRKVKFVADEYATTTTPTPSKKTFTISSVFGLELVQQSASLGLPVDPASIDRSVRADSNTLSMLLAGTLDSLSQRHAHFALAQAARAVDNAVGSLTQGLQTLEDTLSKIRSATTPQDKESLSLADLQLLRNQMEELIDPHYQSLSASSSSTRELMRTLDEDPVSHECSSMVGPRRKAVEVACLRCDDFKRSVEDFKRFLAESQVTEEARLAKVERERQEAEDRGREAERARQEAEERARREAEEIARREEEERLRREAEERARQEAEERARREAEERARQEAEAKARQEAEERARREAEKARQEAEEKARREAEERARREAEERARQEAEERTRREAEKARQEAEERARQEAEERARLEAEERARREAEERARKDDEERALKEAEEQARREAEEKAKLEALELARLETEAQVDPACQSRVAGASIDEDVFVVHVDTPSQDPPGEDLLALQSLIYSLRKRLRSTGINELARPTSSSHRLPTASQVALIEKHFSLLEIEVFQIPDPDPRNHAVHTELSSLRADVDASRELLKQIVLLSKFSALVLACDNALSDLLEHIDSYPSPPMGSLSSDFSSDPSKPPEEQLSDRLRFTERLVGDMATQFALVSRDPRSAAEHDRIQQTWSELNAMAIDRLHGQKSRPASVVSSGRSSRGSMGQSRPAPAATTSKKAAGYAGLSASPGANFLAPPPQKARRAASGSSVKSHNRSSSRLSVASTSTRSVSGPMDVASRLYNSTFASRQRTNSVTSNHNTPSSTPAKKPLQSPFRPRAQTGQDRTASPAMSEVSSMSASRSSLNPSRASISRSSWARAPRTSFPTLPRSPPRGRPSITRKPYIANPKSKLDMAVGEVVNSLPSNVNINVEVVAETWKDQSGKYWIGDQDPKLCFCRILRSQTVMVRVGGGWSELSRFIKDHYADAFRLIPDSPSRVKIHEEKWINSTTLAQAMQTIEASSSQGHPVPPKTPEPKLPFVPSFALSTPSGASPRSLKSGSSPGGSPLTALQFIRRADRESPGLRPETPSKSSRSVASILSTTSIRQPVWRP